MPIKNILNPDHIPKNNYNLIIVGIPILRFTQISGIEQELDVVDLPDRTTASGGNKKAVEFTAMHPKHHVAEDQALEAWFNESTLALPSYKKAGNLVVRSISNLIVRSYTLHNLYVSKRNTPDLAFTDEGELFETEWTFKADDIIAT